MKKLILFFFAIFLSMGLQAQSPYEKEILDDFGTFRMVTDDGNVISVGAFTTIELVDPAVHNDDELLDVIEIEDAKGNRKRVYPEPEYHIDVYLVSKSIFDGQATSTWLDGVKIFIDGKDVRGEQFPDGFLVSVKTEPTLIHSHHTTSKNIDVEIIWETAIYEPRIRK